MHKMFRNFWSKEELGVLAQHTPKKRKGSLQICHDVRSDLLWQRAAREQNGHKRNTIAMMDCINFLPWQLNGFQDLSNGKSTAPSKAGSWPLKKDVFRGREIPCRAAGWMCLQLQMRRLTPVNFNRSRKHPIYTLFRLPPNYKTEIQSLKHEQKKRMEEHLSGNRKSWEKSIC